MNANRNPISRKAFTLQVSALTTIQGIAEVCTQFVHIHSIYTTTDFLIRCKQYTYFAMLHFRVLHQVFSQVHNYGHTGFVIST
ncbi:hypothetical protein D3C87_1687540 [compost metagenome]